MKKIFWIAGVILLLGSCSSTDTTEATTHTHQSDLVEQYIQTFNAHKWSDLAMLYAPSVQVRTSSQGLDPVQVTNVDLVYIYQDLERAFPDIRDSVIAIYHDDHTAIIELISMGISPMGDTLVLPMCQILEFDDEGLITRDYSYYDD